MKKMFLDPIKNRDICFDVIVGNHDVFYKSTNDVNALSDIIKDSYPDFNVYTEATVVAIGDLPILLIPWINQENQARSIEAITTSKAQVAMGHLELVGFEQNRGIVSTHGMDQKLFDNFDLVLSGHYHHKSTNGIIHYLGAPAEFTWSDHNDPRGFHLFDTATRELKFIRNPYVMFKKYLYDDTKITDHSWMDTIDFSEFERRFVKVIVRSRTNAFYFDKFLSKLEKSNPLDVQVVEDHYNRFVEGANDTLESAEDTVSLFKREIDETLISDEEKAIVFRLFNELYSEAINVA